jgi:hypothetical protein
MTRDRSCPINPLATHAVYTKVNIESIAKTIPIYISRTPGVVENVFVRVDSSPEEIHIYTKLFKELCDIFTWSFDEIPGIDGRIIEHEITNYPDANPVR